MSILFGSPVPGARNTSTHRQQSRNNKYTKEPNQPDKVTEEDYVCSLKPEDILENGVNNRGRTPLYPGDAVFLELGNKRLSDISSIDLCERLVVLNLCNNYLNDVTALKWCVNLYALDLHSNQITCLPDQKCWSSLKKLTVLYLHDNGISRLDELRDLSHTPNLINLTLYDTPISLRKNYRHCVVNAIWSLKALDYWVVSDEEIIEDANFVQRFKPMQPQFRFNPSNLSGRQGSTPSLRRSLSHINKEITAINKIQAKYCPVLVMQRMVRGFLIRLRYNYVMDTRLWAAISIQRCFRTFKGYPNPPPGTPLLHYQEFMYQSMSSIKLDYEAYLKMRRSIDPSIFSMKSVHFNAEWRAKNELMNNNLIRKRISVNLEKLMGKATEISLQEDSHYKRVQQPESASDMISKGPRYSARLPSSSPKVEQLSCAEEYAKDLGLNIIPTATNKEQMKVGRYYTQFKFLGPIDKLNFPDITEDVDFRLSIKKPPVMQHNQLEELALRTVEGAEDIRKAIKMIDNERKNSVPKKITPIKKVSGRRSLSDGGSQNMAFSCFRAIDKAYRDREKMEELLKRNHLVKTIKEMEDLSLEQVRAHQFNQRNAASIQKKKDKLILLNALAKRKQQEYTELDKIDAYRNLKREKQRKRTDNLNFAREFNCQNASVGKALANHDRSNIRDEDTSRKSEHVEALRTVTEKKREVINGYVKNLKLARQMEGTCMNRNLRDLMKEKGIESLDEQVNRIKEQKLQKGTYMIGATVLPVKQFRNPVEYL